jgi:hypothetical protein
MSLHVNDKLIGLLYKFARRLPILKDKFIKFDSLYAQLGAVCEERDTLRAELRTILSDRGRLELLNSMLESHEGQTLLLANCEQGIAKLVTRMALGGEGTDCCLESGSIPLPVHFYSPVPDVKELQKRNVLSQQTSMPGIDMRDTEQIELLKLLVEQYGHECSWPSDPVDDSFHYYTNNNSFNYGCAAALHCMIRHFKPRRVIEIGSGNSSRVLLSALQKNKQESFSAEYSIVDPYPSELLLKIASTGDFVIHTSCVELLPYSFFDVLGADDVLFIDSSHVSKTGSDVNYLYLEVLPRLNPGVIIHIHDICLPREYPEVYYTSPTFRMFWTEAYILQAFLAFNDQFEVLLAMIWLQINCRDEFISIMNKVNMEEKWYASSFWLRRKVTNAVRTTH